MNDMSNKDLIKQALAVMNPVEVNGHWRGGEMRDSMTILESQHLSKIMPKKLSR